MDKIRQRLDRLESHAALGSPMHWRARAEALEWLEDVWPIMTDDDRAGGLIARAQAMRARLEQADAALHRRLRAAIRAGRGPELLQRWLVEASSQAVDGEGYDALDALVAGVLQVADPGDALVPLAPDMVFYQPTPARHVLDMLGRTALGPDDVLVDLGAGLGHVPMLAALCTGARAVGVEWQPAYVACARRAARTLGLDAVRFVAQDARHADLSAGTVFFLYTPFGGAVLREVLDALRAEAARRPIRLCTFGPCTAAVAGEPWLRAEGPWPADRVALFHAVGHGRTRAGTERV